MFFKHGIIPRVEGVLSLNLIFVILLVLWASVPCLGQDDLSRGLHFLELKDYESALACFQSAINRDPDQVTPHLLMARTYLEADQPLGSIDVLEKAAELFPSNGDIPLQLGGLYFDQKDYERAIYYFERTLELNPFNTLVVNEALGACYFNLGVLAFQGGQWDKAAEQFEKCLKCQPENLQAYNNLAVVRFKQKRPQDALKAVEQGLAYHPNDPLLLKLKAQSYSDQQDYAQLLEVYEEIHAQEPENLDAALDLAMLYRYQRKPEKALGLYDHLMEKHPTERRVYDTVAEYHANLFRYGEVREVYERLERNVPGDLSISKKIAETYEKEHKWPEARAKYEEILQKAPDDLDIHLKIAQTYRQEKKRFEALAQYQQALTIAPTHFETQKNIATLYEELGQFKEALQVYRRMVSQDSTRAYSYIRMGNIFERRWDVEEAMAAYSTAIEVGTDEALPYHRLSVLYCEKGNRKRAEEYRKRAVRKALEKLKTLQGAMMTELEETGGKLDLTNMDRLSRTGASIEEPEGILRETLDTLMGQDEEAAASELSILLKEYPRSRILLEYRGRYYEDHAQWKKALRTYERLIKVHVKSKAGHTGMARVLEKMGQEGSAILAYRRAWELDPHDKIVYEALMRLHRKAGTLSDIIEQWQREREVHPENAILREYLIKALKAAHREDEARQVSQQIR